MSERTFDGGDCSVLRLNGLSRGLGSVNHCLNRSGAADSPAVGADGAALADVIMLAVTGPTPFSQAPSSVKSAAPTSNANRKAACQHAWPKFRFELIVLSSPAL